MTDPIGDENGSDRGGSGWPVKATSITVGLVLVAVFGYAGLIRDTRQLATLTSIPSTPLAITGPATPAPARASTPDTPAEGAGPVVATIRTVSPRPGSDDGMISLTREVCGSSASWVAQARANGITGPDWIVADSARLTIDCSRPVVVLPVPASKPHPTPAASPTPAWQSATGVGWGYPVPRGTCVTSHYGAPRDGGTRIHKGTDLGAGYGTPIRSMAAGTVASSGWEDNNAGYGVEVRHAGGVVTQYFHMNRTPLVHTGQHVDLGQLLGYVGASGDATGPHLHLGVIVGGSHVNPETWLPAHTGLRLGC